MLQQSAISDPQAERLQRRMLAWTTLAAVAVLLAMTRSLWTGRLHTHDDLGAFHLPLRVFYSQQLARGEPFDWLPNWFGGFYASGEGQLGAYHPLHWLLYRFLPLPAAYESELLLSYPLMLAGAYLLLRRRLGRRDAAMLGSLIFIFSSFNLLHFVHTNAIAVVAHIPWLLWAIDIVICDEDRRKRSAARAAIALLTGSQLLLGYPQYVWLSLLAEGSWTAFLLVQSRRPSQNSMRSALAIVLGLVMAKALGAMLGAVQLLPTYDVLANSARRTTDPNFANTFFLHPLNLVQLLSPYFFTDRVLVQNTHEFGLYIGAVPVMLIAWLRCRHRELGSLRALAVWTTIFAGVAMLLAFGPAGQLYRLQRLLPIVGGFRCPCRYIVLWELAASVLASIGFVLLLRAHAPVQQPSWRELRPLWLVVAVSVVIAAIGLALRHRQPLIASSRDLLTGPVLMAVAALLVTQAARGRRAALVGLVLFTALDLGWYGLSYAIWKHTHPLDEYIRIAAATPPADAEAAKQYRLYSVPNTVSLAGWRAINGYAGLEPARRLDYKQVAALQVASVRWARRNKVTLRIEGLRPIDSQWLEVPDPLPRVRLVTRVQASQAPAAELAHIELRSTVLVDEPLDLPHGEPGTAVLIAERPGRMEIRTDCRTRQLLVVSESFHPGWQATVDGRPEPVVGVNADFLGCLVGPGAQQLVLEFRPASLRAGKLVTYVGLALLLVSVAINFGAGARKSF